jgi:hypothetical protein
MIAISLNTPIPSNHQLVFICTSSRCVSCLLVPDLARFGGILWRFLFFALELSLSQRLQWGWLHLVSWCLYSCLVLSCLVLSCLVLSCLVLSCQPSSQSASQPASLPNSQPANQLASQPASRATRQRWHPDASITGWRSRVRAVSLSAEAHVFRIESLTFCLSKGVAC